ncbi:MAG: CRTAC1 family protein [Acidobacteriota bacterium]|nr:CRTAC1 family protein [Acidobacteriota bacterium]
MRAPSTPNHPGPIAPVMFRNVAAGAGVDFVLNNNPTPEKHMIETMAGGIAAFDYNGDGLTDIFFTNGASIPSLEKSAPKFHNRLYRNLGDWKFADVTEEAGLAGAGYSMGAAAADYDNDGRVDLFVAGVFHNILYRNLGNGMFEDVTAKSGIKSDKWSVAAGWFDYDNDGWLDLWVVNYAKWSVSDNRFCGDRERNIRAYCHPRYLDGLPCTLYRNRRDGTFEDVTDASGVGKHIGRGMSLAFADYDGDGFTDVFVTNDNQGNFLFHNRGNGAFEEVGLLAGVALLNSGEPVSNMGVDFRDYNNDGLPDVAVTDLNQETFPLFRNLGHSTFEDATFASRLAMLTAPRSGWSNGFFDFNNDGWKDLFTANSHVDSNVSFFQSSISYKQPNSIFINACDGTFVDGSPGAGADFQVAAAHRGAAFADFDQDGKIDVVTSSLGGEAELWRNVSPNQNHWIIFRLRGSKSNRDGIGARIRIGGQSNHMTSAVGYASSSHFGVHFGLGAIKIIPQVEIRWPSGHAQRLLNVAVNQTLVIHEPE